MRRSSFYSGFVRQHKDDFIIRLHDVVVIVLCFRDYDGAFQIEARCIDPPRGLVDGTFRRKLCLGIPVQ